MGWSWTRLGYERHEKATGMGWARAWDGLCMFCTGHGMGFALSGIGMAWAEHGLGSAWMCWVWIGHWLRSSWVCLGMGCSRHGFGCP